MQEGLESSLRTETNQSFERSSNSLLFAPCSSRSASLVCNAQFSSPVDSLRAKLAIN